MREPFVAGGEPREFADTGVLIVGFAEGADGELYVLDFGLGRIYHIVPAP